MGLGRRRENSSTQCSSTVQQCPRIRRHHTNSCIGRIASPNTTAQHITFHGIASRHQGTFINGRHGAHRQQGQAGLEVGNSFTMGENQKCPPENACHHHRRRGMVVMGNTTSHREENVRRRWEWGTVFQRPWYTAPRQYSNGRMWGGSVNVAHHQVWSAQKLGNGNAQRRSPPAYHRSERPGS